MNMRSFDFAPLYRSSVGFDRLAQAMDSLVRHDGSSPSYPPYNIEKTGDDSYRISLALAGFSESEVHVETCGGQLTISGSRHTASKNGNGSAKEGANREFLYQGIAERSFERRFELDALIRVKSASMENGLLHIDLEREIPEELKPRSIPVGRSAPIAA